MCLLWVANFRSLTSGFARLPTLSWTFIIGNVSTTYTGSFTRRGSIPIFYHPIHIFIYMYATMRFCLTSANGTESTNHSITKHSVDSYHALTPMSYDVPMHNAMRCATTCLCHTTFVRNAIWTTQTTQFIMCHGQLY